MFPSTVDALGFTFVFTAGFVVVVFAASQAYNRIFAVCGYVIELLAFVALADGRWGLGLLHSVLKQIHVEALVEKAGSLVRVCQVNFEKCGWLLGGSADDSVYSVDEDALAFQLFFDSCFTDVDVDAFNDQEFHRGVRWKGGTLFPCQSASEVCTVERSLRPWCEKVVQGRDVLGEDEKVTVSHMNQFMELDLWFVFLNFFDNGLIGCEGAVRGSEVFHDHWCDVLIFSRLPSCSFS